MTTFSLLSLRAKRGNLINTNEELQRLLKYQNLLFSFIVLILLIFPNYSNAQEDSVRFAKDDTLPSVIKKEPHNWDVYLFRTINNNRSKFKDAVIPVFDKSALTMTVLMPIAMFGYGRIYDKTYDENTGYLLGVSEVTNFAITLGIKYIVKRKRPYASLSNVYRKDFSTTDPYSFPSGHTSTSFTIATAFALRYSKYPQVYLPMYAWACIVGYGRPYLGMHYPGDVIGGVLIGTGSSVLIYSLRSSLFKLKNNILSENKSDDGSINGGTLTIFAASFLAGSVFNQIFFKNNDKIIFGALPLSNNRAGVSLNMNWMFSGK